MTPGPIKPAPGGDLAKLQTMVANLHRLLEDPHPGLMTWNEAVSKRLKELHDFYRARGGR